METFIVRTVPVGPGEPDGGADAIRGVARRVSDGEELTFTSGTQLIEFLRLAEPDRP